MSRLGLSTRPGATGPSDAQLLSLGKLFFLASYCPLHRKFPTAALSRLFAIAVNNDCVRFFENEDKKTSAALIWARLSEDVADRMIQDRVPPGEADWVSGNTLWFLDLLAPFGQGRQIARHIARHPPAERFCFARIDDAGRVRKVVQGNAGAERGKRLSSRIFKAQTS